MLSTLAPLLLFLFPLAYSPGPGNMTFAAMGARFGVIATLPASMGYHLATWVMTFLIGIGALGIMSTSPTAYKTVKVIGVIYMLYLAYRIATAGHIRRDQTAKPLSFPEGVLLLVLNPKAYVIIALMFAQFIAPERAAHQQVFWITTIFTINNMIAFLVWAAVGDQLARIFSYGTSAHVLNIIFGSALVLVAVWMLVAK